MSLKQTTMTASKLDTDALGQLRSLLRSRNRAGSTIDTYHSNLVQFLKWAGQEPIHHSELETRAIEFFHHQVAAGLEASTVRARRVAILQYMDAFDIPRGEVDEYTPPRLPEPEPDPLPGGYDDLMRLDDYLAECGDEGFRVFCAFQSFLGLRFAEANKVTPSMVEFTGHEQQVRLTTKGGKRRVLPLTPACTRAIATRHLTMGSGLDPSKAHEPMAGIAKSTAYRHFDRVCKRLGFPEDTTPHTLRATFATTMFDLTGGNEAVVQAYLGHDDPKTTRKHYIGGDLNRMREVAHLFE